MSYDALQAFALLALLGGLVGLIAGLLGTGGGLIVVPALIFGFAHLGVTGPEVPQIAAATALALVIPTALASTQAHAAKGSVDWRYFAILSPLIMAGALTASFFALRLDARFIVLLFIVTSVFIAWSFLKPAHEEAAETADKLSRGAMGTIAIKTVGSGGIASLLGFGAGLFCVPILSRFLPLPTAVGTSSALSLPLALAGVIGYLVAPPPPGCALNCAGVIYLPAVAAIGMASVLTAPLGTRLAHVLPVPVLKRIFAGIVIVSAIGLARKSLPAVTIEAPSARALLAKLRAPVCSRRGGGKVGMLESQTHQMQ